VTLAIWFSPLQKWSLWILVIIYAVNASLKLGLIGTFAPGLIQNSIFAVIDGALVMGGLIGTTICTQQYIESVPRLRRDDGHIGAFLCI
jgi:hypothetical protein